MTLDVDVRRQLGGFTLDARFACAGPLTALFGHSGSGKTTLVNVIAGLERPEAGRIAVDGRTLVDTKARVFVPAHRRRIGYIFQDARLFPHLTVRQNIAYGRFFTPRADRWADVPRIVEMLGIGPFLDRRPRHLSGGEKQRAAIGRALAASPRLLLMDEPFAALDEERKAGILPYVERLRDELGIPIVYVSHAIAEVARLATDVVVLAAGRAVASGPAAEVLSQLDLALPESRDETASLVEVVLEGRDPGYGLSLLRAASGVWRVPQLEALPGARMRVRVRARDVMLALDRPARISALNVFPATVLRVAEAPDAPDALIELDASGDRLLARVTRRTVATLELRRGVELWAIVKAVSIDGSTSPGGGPLSGLAPTGPGARS